MKKTFKILLITLFVLLITACKKEEFDNDELEEAIDNGKQEEIDYSELKNLEYYEYLDESNPIVKIEVKDFGVMEVELFPNLVKTTVDNFLRYVEEDAFNNNSFHRIIEDFMIQGGAVENTYPPIIGEFSSNGVNNDLKHYKGVISMARTIIPNSATSQFFIVHKDSPHLNGSYASFGGLISGFDVLDKIAEVKTNYNDAPLEEVVITKITVNLRGYSRNEW